MIGAMMSGGAMREYQHLVPATALRAGYAMSDTNLAGLATTLRADCATSDTDPVFFCLLPRVRAHAGGGHDDELRVASSLVLCDVRGPVLEWAAALCAWCAMSGADIGCAAARTVTLYVGKKPAAA
eukprot:3715910-Rhodomonas_salina.1